MSASAAVDLKKSATTPTIVDESKLTSQTPEKMNEPCHSHFFRRQSESQEADCQPQLPPKYRIIADLFDHVNCSLRLLRLRKRSPTFQNVSAQVQVLAQRKLLCRHLAQMKFILPEAIKIDSTLVQDKKTLCTNPDMNITLLVDVVQAHSQVSDFIALRQVFNSRLIHFFAMHPEACDVPEAILPEPFSQRQRAVVAQTEKAQLLASPSPLPSDGARNNMSSNSESISELDIKNGKQKESCSEFRIINHSVQLNHPQCSIASSVSESPLVKLTSSADSFMVQTPAPLTPRRSMPSCGTEHETINSQSTSCYKPAKRILDFSHSEGDKIALDCTTDESDYYKVVNQNIPKTTETPFEDENVTCSLEPQEVKQIIGYADEDCKRSQNSASLCQQNSSCLDDLVTTVHSIFKSLNWSPITKEELVHKITMSSLDIVERREVEQQIDLLERQAPDWIHGELYSSGDTMYNIKKVADLKSVVSKLKAKMIQV